MIGTNVKIKEVGKGAGLFCVVYTDKFNQVRRTDPKTRSKALQLKKQIEKRALDNRIGHLNADHQYIPTLQEYVSGWRDLNGDHPGWLDTQAGIYLKLSTRNSYKQILINHVIPDFGHKRLDAITSRMIREMVFKLFDKNLRSQTVKNVKHCLSAVLETAATQDQYLKANPAHKIKVQKPQNEKPSRVPLPFTFAERLHFEDTFLNLFPDHHPLVFLGFRTGLRIGEILGLQWQDIDFENKIIHVQRSITRGKVTAPKSKAGKRKVRMTAKLCRILQSHRKRCQAITIDKQWAALPDWVFINQIGKFPSYSNFIQRKWRPAAAKAGFKNRTPHDMRHTYATLRISKGHPIAEVSKEMGHSTARITYERYYKWIPFESDTDIDDID